MLSNNAFAFFSSCSFVSCRFDSIRTKPILFIAAIKFRQQTKIANWMNCTSDYSQIEFVRKETIHISWSPILIFMLQGNVFEGIFIAWISVTVEKRYSTLSLNVGTGPASPISHFSNTESSIRPHTYKSKENIAQETTPLFRFFNSINHFNVKPLSSFNKSLKSTLVTRFIS